MTPPIGTGMQGGTPPPLATKGTAPVPGGTVLVGGTPPPFVSGATTADGISQKDMDTLEAEEESSCGKGCSGEAAEASIVATGMHMGMVDMRRMT
jgi:hypothetical protein